jgi:antitoxin ParD1/3/4
MGRWAVRCPTLDKLCQLTARFGQRSGAMATMNISLPDAMKDWVEAQSADGRYANSSDYVRDLIRRDQDRRAKIAAMQDKIDEALASGVSPLSRDEVWAQVRAKAQLRCEAAE